MVVQQEELQTMNSGMDPEPHLHVAEFLILVACVVVDDALALSLKMNL
jgi:hypothetical protein